MMLELFEWITLTEIHLNGVKHRHLSPLSAVQQQILELMGLTITVYPVPGR
nr:MAG: hypothetical protein BECKH772A_GA0070896_101228 [Candidatus Kentron sp. H]VFK03210.1 MAG: hypothetical protein BECKH772C_GA0070978_101188 [Candidatus Kentron sp. H]VFK07825.1 MAG: hypothetical protein BECKH772C_GA0070978_104592 [Candidatus Kentron sp. H]